MTKRSTNPRASAARRHGLMAVIGGLYAIAVLLVGALSGSGAAADPMPSAFLVIVHPKNPQSSISQDFLAQAFFKQTTRWSHGEAIHPVDLPMQSPVRRAFSSIVLKRSAPAVRGYWLQRIFSGRQVPPPELDSDEAVIRYVLASPGAVGYIAATDSHANVKVLTVR